MRRKLPWLLVTVCFLATALVHATGQPPRAAEPTRPDAHLISHGVADSLADNFVADESEGIVPVTDLAPPAKETDSSYLEAVRCFHAIPTGKRVADLYPQQYDRAITLLLATLNRKPRSVAAGRLLARIYLEQERFPQSEELCRRLLALQPTATDYNNLAFVLFKEQRAREAIEAYRASLRLDPHNYLAMKNLASIYFLRTDLRQSETYMNRMLKLYPQRLYAYSSLIVVYARENRVEDAERICRAALQQHPNHSATARLLASLGEILSEEGRPEEARQTLYQAIREANQAPQMRDASGRIFRMRVEMSLSRMLRSQGQPNAAMAVLQNAFGELATIHAKPPDMLLAERESVNEMLRRR